ncbi:Mannose-1-phosphate guanylyltransferase [hydrothermal vent metagenome]|uniref:Mannose-1-phosphate guanylyltransferase n=1 Tax=hydrothermal vent metagenome TaxID=652676 RepID=A0A3B1DN46_9ZZZZ
MLHSVIMSGGSGTRFWPRSRNAMPKQLLSFTDNKSMIQEAVERTERWIPLKRTWVVTNKKQLSATKQQLSQLASSQFIVEPTGRNTAPCIGLAACTLLAENPDATMLVMPADHLISQQDAFKKAVEQAEDIIKKNPDAFVLFGVRPSYPATGFGYIEQGESIDKGVFKVQSFREKPDLPTATQLMNTGRFYWNCGIFMWRADRILEALGKFEPEMFSHLQTLQQSISQENWESVLELEFPKMKSISIDYAVLERAEEVFVLEAPFDWDDLGSWQALARINGVDKKGNAIDIDANFCGEETTGCIVYSSDENHLIATYGVDDLIIVHTKDATLVARKDDEQGLKQLVAKLKSEGHDDKL